MRTLHVIDSLTTGGAEIMLKQICAAQFAAGIRPSVYVCRASESELGSNFVQPEIPLYKSGCNQLRSPVQVVRLARHLKRHRYDIIHVHLFPAQLWAALAALMVRNVCPIVTTEHNTWNRRRKPLFRALDKWMYRRFRAVICISEAVRTNLENWIGSDSCEFYVVLNGIDLTRFPHGRPSFSPDRNELTILSVGSLCGRKDHATLLRALSRLKSGKVLLAGDGELRESLGSLAVQLNIADRVHFLGCRHDVPALMASADVYVQPSRVEGFGLAPLEAMASGLPVITSDAPGMREIVAGAGLTFPAGNADALADRLREVLSSSQYRAELSDASRQRASLFSVDKTVRGYQDVYEAVLSRSSSAGR
jgi:glycosyltransferase involved in cell wall biosynthesis